MSDEKLTKIYDGMTVEREGRTFRINIEQDDDSTPPWEKQDGNGIVSDWTSRDKRPGELVLNTDRGSHRFYDFPETMKLAKKDGWGLCDEDKAALAKKLGHEPSKGEVTEEAVRRDFEFLRSWCNDEWTYVGVIVTDVTDDEDRKVDYMHALWGIESNADEYLAEVAEELIADALRASREEREKREQAKREAQARADALNTVIASARLVVDRWENGDLAKAVRELGQALHTYDELEGG